MEHRRGQVRALVVLAVVAVLPALVLGAGGSRSGLPVRINLYVAVPADQPVRYAIADAALHEAELAMDWLEDQAGRELSRRPADFAEIVALPIPAADLVGDPRAAFELIHAELVAHADDPAVFPLVLADVRTTSGGETWLTCGLGGVRGVVMFLGNCPDDELSTASAWGSAASVTIAHELVHGLGAVAACAPHASPDGHVTDDPADLLFAGRRSAAPGGVIALDAGRDDYLGHGIPDCPDVLDSPLWH